MVELDAEKPEPCTTYTRRKLHLSCDLTVRWWSGGGKAGLTLCGLEASDEERANTNRRSQVVVADLPRCKTCESLVARREEIDRG